MTNYAKAVINMIEFKNIKEVRKEKSYSQEVSPEMQKLMLIDKVLINLLKEVKK